MAMVDDCMINGGYEVKKYDDQENPLSKIEVKESIREIDPDQDDESIGWEEVVEENVIYLDDDFDLSDKDSANS